MTTVKARALSADEAHTFAAARLAAINQAPYFAQAILSMAPLAADGLGTFAVDGRWRLYLDPATLTTWGPQLAGAVLVHEVNHLLREHSHRAQGLGSGLNHKRWNYATDAAINDDLIEAGVILPVGAVTPQALGLEPGGIEESYYAALTPPSGSKESEDGEDDGEGCGSGAGDKPAPWELEGKAPLAPGLSDAEAARVRLNTARAVIEHGSKGRGTVPAGLARWAGDQVRGPVVNWRTVLARTIRRAAQVTAGRVNYSYARPGRRQLPGIVTPAMRAPKVSAAVVLDTSGSISGPLLDAALAEAEGVIKAIGGRVSVITCDAAASAAQVVRTVDGLALTGGGGTDMREGIAAAEKLRPAPDVVVVLTDGYTPWPERPGRAVLVVAVIGNGKTTGIPSWARLVVVPSTA